MLRPAVQILERTSKAAVAASVFLLVALQLSAHADLTPTLRGLGIAAFAVGWMTGRRWVSTSIAAWLLFAPLAPATLRALTGREGTVLDIVWMAGLAGSLLRATTWSTWSPSLPPTWRVLLGGWTLTLALTWPVIVAREVGFAWNGFSDIGAINSWAMLSAPQVAGWTMSVALTQLLAVLWFDWFLEQRRLVPAEGVVPEGVVPEDGAVPKDRFGPVDGLWIGVTVAGLVALYQGTIDMAFWNQYSWAALRRATGTMLDANGYGMAAALVGPIAFLRLRAWQAPWAAPLAVGALALNGIGLWMSGSRTAFLAGGLGLLALGIGQRLIGQGGIGQRGLGQPRSPSRVALRLAALASVAVAATAVLLFATNASGPLERLRAIPASAAGLDWLWNRFGYGTAAMHMLREFPLTGVGLGAYHVLVPDYSRLFTDVALPFDNAQNWWRHQAAELGLLGSLPILAWSALLAARVLRPGAWAGEPGSAWVGRGLLLGLGLASLLGVPTQSPVVLIAFWLLVAWSLPGGATARHGPRPAPRWLPTLALACLLCAVGEAAAHAVIARGTLAVATRAARAGRNYVAGAYTPEDAPGIGEFRWTGARARFVWGAETPLLRIQLWAQHPDLDQMPVRVTVTTPCQVLFDEPLGTNGGTNRGTDREAHLGLEIPEGLRTIDATVRVSRTWQPSAFGGDDTRRLGVGLAARFVDRPSEFSDQARVVALRACP